MSSCLLVTISHWCGNMPGNVGKVYLTQCLRNDTVYHRKMSYYMVHCVRNCHSVLQSDFNIFSNDNMTTEYSSQHFTSLVWHNLSNGIGIQEAKREKYLCLYFCFPPFSSVSGLSKSDIGLHIHVTLAFPFASLETLWWVPQECSS